MHTYCSFLFWTEEEVDELDFLGLALFDLFSDIFISFGERRELNNIRVIC